MCADYYIECGANLDNGYFTRNVIIKPENVLDFRVKHKNKGVYCSTFLYDSKDLKTANILADLYIDLDYDLSGTDSVVAFEKIQKEVKKIVSYLKIIFQIHSDDIYFYFSGSKGVHIIIPKEIFNIEPSKNLNQIFKAIVTDMIKINNLETVDTKIYDRRRLLRLPNSIHSKTNLYKIPITYDECLKLNLLEIQALAKSPRRLIKKSSLSNPIASNEFKRYSQKVNQQLSKKKTNTTIEFKKSDYRPPCIDYVLKNPVKSGQRNNTMVFLSSFCMQNGYTEDETIDLIEKWNEKVVVPSLEENEIKTSVHSVFAGKHIYGCSSAVEVSVCDKSNCKFIIGRY